MLQRSRSLNLRAGAGTDLQVGDVQLGAASPASPAGGGSGLIIIGSNNNNNNNSMTWAPNSAAPVQRSNMSVLQDPYHHHHHHHPSSLSNAGNAVAAAAGAGNIMFIDDDDDLEGKHHHHHHHHHHHEHDQYSLMSSRKAINLSHNKIGKARTRLYLKAEQTVHLIPLVLLLCALFLWLSTPSEHFNPAVGINQRGDNVLSSQERYEDLIETQESIKETISGLVLKNGNHSID